MEKKFLPIGSVVLLNNGSKKVMINGFCAKTVENPTLIYDYLGCLYPEGVIRSDLSCVFNHDQIGEVFFTGFKNEEENDFKDLLIDRLNIKENDQNDNSFIPRLVSEPAIEHL